MNISLAGCVRCCCAAALLGALLSSAPAVAQSYSLANGHDDDYGTQKKVTLAVTRFAEARGAITGFLGRRAVRVRKQEETPDRLTADFVLLVRDLPRFDSLTMSLGYVLENNLTARDLDAQLHDLRADEQRLTAQLADAQEQLRTSKSAEFRATLEKQADDYRARLAQNTQRVATIVARTGQAAVSLSVFDEVTTPTGKNAVSFVNMPGVEYGYLRLDNPKPGLTSRAYQGYAVKYLFTRGKSYFNLGVYKPLEKNSTDQDFVNELFVINFGQDFYPRNFGRGRRRYLNLYTSYQVGGFILSRNSDQRGEFIPNLNLGLGLELLKTRHVLLDTKASYFVPLNDRSRDLRGLLGQASFNFVF